MDATGKLLYKSVKLGEESVPRGKKMLEKRDMMLEKQDVTTNEIRGLREDLNRPRKSGLTGLSAK